MKDPKNVWLTWLQAKQFKCLPSDLLGITDQPIAFYFNRAVFTFGVALEAELEKASESRGSGKRGKSASQITMARQGVMSRWLGTQQFADPARKG